MVGSQSIVEDTDLAESSTHICDYHSEQLQHRTDETADRQNGTSSPLLRLPPELRLMIYSYVFDTAHVYIAPIKYTMEGALVEHKLCTSTLPTVCRQLHYETMALRHTYTHVDMAEAYYPRSVANAIGYEKCASIRSLTISSQCSRNGFRFHGVKSMFSAIECVTVKGEVAPLQEDKVATYLRKLMGKPSLDVQFVV